MARDISAGADTIYCLLWQTIRYTARGAVRYVPRCGTFLLTNNVECDIICVAKARRSTISVRLLPQISGKLKSFFLPRERRGCQCTLLGKHFSFFAHLLLQLLLLSLILIKKDNRPALTE